jgi:hypothetical protein
MVLFVSALLACVVANPAANPWDKYMLAPGPDRTQRPVAWRRTAAGGTPAQPSAGGAPWPAQPLPVRLSGAGDSLMFDWGQETGGFTTLFFGGASDAAQSVSLAYSEASYYWTGGDHSNGGKGPDGTISTGPIALANSSYTPPAAHMRGGFRYLNLALETDGWVDVLLPSVHFTAAPNNFDPSAWANHFYSSDETLNKVWYGCGYTAQLCSIDPAHGRTWPAPSSGWNNSCNVGMGSVVLVDGAKRDRLIWPGDMGVSSLTAIATTGDLEASRNALDTLYRDQGTTAADGAGNAGYLPYVGPPIDAERPAASRFASDSYHLWALLGTYNVATHDADDAWLVSVWDGFRAGVGAARRSIDAATGLFNCSRAAGWQRNGFNSVRGFSSFVNMLAFRAHSAGAELAARLGHAAVAAEYGAQAAALRSAIALAFWDEGKGAFVDNTAHRALHPQDGNALAVWFNVTADAAQAARVSDYLASNWGPFGASSPEWNNSVGTFPGSMEVHAHMAAGDAQRAHDLIRLQWGYMLNKPESVRSTFWEGYNADGSFNFKGIYMSNAHGWATGPAAALTFGTLGIKRRPAAGPGGAFAFVVAPLFGDLEHCQGRLAFAPGAHVGAAWNVSAAAVTLAVDSATMPRAARGSVTVALAGIVDRARRHAPRAPLARVTVNGVLCWARGRGLLCEAGERCGVEGVGAIGVRGVLPSGAPGGAPGVALPSGTVVEVLGVQPQMAFVLELSFAL